MLIKTDIQEITDFYNKIQVAQENYEREISKLSRELNASQKEKLVGKERKSDFVSKMSNILLNEKIEAGDKLQAISKIVSDIQDNDLPF